MSYVYYKDQTDNQVYGYDTENQQELIAQAIANGWEDITGSWPLPPSPPTAEDNKATAVSLLQSTDWTTIPDVGDPEQSNPYLTNQGAFIAYRNAVRQIAINPIAGDLTWPTQPTEQWSS